MNQKLIVFVNHRDAPAILLVVVSMVALYSLILWAILSSVLVIVWLINILWIEHKYDIIIQYHSLMNPLGELSRIDSNGNQIFLKLTEVIKNPPNNVNLTRCWGQYCELKLKQMDVNNKFNGLSQKLDYLCGFRYRLLWINDTASIEEEFKNLFSETKSLHEDFIKVANCGNISLEYLINCNALIAAYKEFFTTLDTFIEIRNAVKMYLSSPLFPQYDPAWDGWGKDGT